MQVVVERVVVLHAAMADQTQHNKTKQVEKWYRQVVVNPWRVLSVVLFTRN